jgi:hypothetical protein
VRFFPAFNLKTQQHEQCEQEQEQEQEQEEEEEQEQDQEQGNLLFECRLFILKSGDSSLPARARYSDGVSKGRRKE